MIIPISHEDHEGRRWPVVTIAILIACVCVHLFFVATGGIERGFDDVRATGASAVEYLAEHPYLTPPPRLAAWLAEDLPPEAKNGLAAAREDGAPPGVDVAAQQAELERRYGAFEAAVQHAPVFRYGFVPRLRNWGALLTCMFVHGGWIHLLGNLWMLWLCGCNLEDRWGRPVFAGVYVLSGIGATLLHSMFFPISFAPLVGASGAIAGAMGGFLVLFFSTKIRFAYLFFFAFRLRAGTFSAPAYVMLPLWLGWEVLSALRFSGSGVAHWAHVGGFVTGLAAALALRFSGMEKRLDAAVDAKVTVRQDPRILAAQEHTDQGQPGQAIALLQEVLREDPGHIDALLALVRAADAARDDALQADACARLIERYWAIGEVDVAISLFEEPKPPGVEERIPRTLALRVARHFAASKQASKAAAVCARLRRGGLMDETAVRAAVLEAGVRQGMGDVGGARALLVEARESPFSTLEIDQMIDAQLAKVGSAVPGVELHGRP